jgi:hypothetical protein
MFQGVSAWCSILEKRFRIPSSQTLRILENFQYIIWDAANKKSLIGYFSSIILATRNCGYNEYSQILLAWNYIDPELRIFIDKFDERTSITDFMKIL